MEGMKKTTGGVSARGKIEPTERKWKKDFASSLLIVLEAFILNTSSNHRIVCIILQRHCITCMGSQNLSQGNVLYTRGQVIDCPLASEC